MIHQNEIELFQELKNYILLTSGEIVECKRIETAKDFLLKIKLSHSNPNEENPYCFFTRLFENDTIDINRVLTEIKRYVNVSEMNNFNWLWCKLCDHPIIECEKCNSYSCTGGGCDECWYDFELANYLVGRGFHPSEESIEKVGSSLEELNKLFKSKI